MGAIYPTGINPEKTIFFQQFAQKINKQA